MRASPLVAFLLVALSLVCLPAVAQERARPAEASAELLVRARAIHDRVLTLDTHKDIPDQLAPEQLPSDPATRERFRRKFDPTVDGDAQVDFPKMRRGGYDAAFFIVYVPQGPLNEAGYHTAYKAAMRKFDAIHRMCRLYPGDIELARSPDDVERIVKSGKLCACIGIENGYPIGEDLSHIQEFYQLGGRYMSIAHNRHSQLGDSHTPVEPLHGGLSELGRKAIAEMNRLGIMVDVSHAAKTTMLQACELSVAPVIASHSACRALRDHSRNLDDEQLRALKKNGGVIQVVGLGSFVKDESERDAAIAALRKELGLAGDHAAKGDQAAAMAEFEKRMVEIDRLHPAGSVKDFVDHLDHAVEIVGIDHVGIASDFDGGGGVVGWNNAGETFNVTLELVRRGYSEQDIAKIWSGNTLALWRRVEAVARRLQAGGK